MPGVVEVLDNTYYVAANNKTQNIQKNSGNHEFKCNSIFFFPHTIQVGSFHADKRSGWRKAKG